MWESLIAGAIGGIMVNGFGIAVGALLWVKQQRWTVKQEIYSEILPMLSRLIHVNRWITKTMDRVKEGETPNAQELEKWFGWIEERNSLNIDIDRRYGYFKLFVSKRSQEAITILLESTHNVSGTLKDSLQAAIADPKKQMEEFHKMTEAQRRLITLSEEALKGVYLSAEEDLRFAFEIPFTGYVIGEGKVESVPKADQSKN